MLQNPYFERKWRIIMRISLILEIPILILLIADIDEDGQNELLIAANDGYLYCYETNGSGFIYWGQFRGNNFNTGVL